MPRRTDTRKQQRTEAMNILFKAASGELPSKQGVLASQFIGFIDEEYRREENARKRRALAAEQREKSLLIELDGNPGAGITGLR